MTRFYLTHTDDDGERHQLPGTFNAATPAQAIAKMLKQAGEQDDGRWLAHERPHLGAAIAKGRRDVQLIGHGTNEWSVQTWSAKHRAWWMGGGTHPWAMAAAMAREARIRVALTALQIPEPEATAMQLAERTGHWDEIVADYIREQRK